MIVSNITKDNIIKEPISIEINTPSAIAIIGRNGKGKTTLLRILSGSLLPDNGSISFDDHFYNFPLSIKNIIQYKEDFCKNTFYAEHLNYLYSNWSCKQNIEYYTSIGSYDNLKIHTFLDCLDFEKKYMNKRIKELSLGTIKKIILSFALSSTKKIVLLDEPTLGLDEESKKSFANIIEDQKKEKNFIISTNDNFILNIFDVFFHCKDEGVVELNDIPYFQS